MTTPTPSAISRQNLSEGRMDDIMHEDERGDGSNPVLSEDTLGPIGDDIMHKDERGDVSNPVLSVQEDTLGPIGETGRPPRYALRSIIKTPKLHEGNEVFKRIHAGRRHDDKD